MLCDFIRTFQNSYNKFISEQYQSWKKQEFQMEMDLIQIPTLFISFIIILIKLIINKSDSELYIQLSINCFSHLFLGILIKKNHSCKAIMTHIIRICQIILINWYCLYFYMSNPSFLLIYTTFNVIQFNMAYTILVKLVTLGICMGGYLVSVEDKSYECLGLFILIMIIHMIRREGNLMSFYSKLQALFLIIDTIPSAMCIVQKNKSQLLYSNKSFENLSLTLEGSNNSDTDQSPDRFINYQKLQLHFLSNLQLTELNQQGISIIDFDDELQIDQYKIRKVNYKKEALSPECGSRQLIFNLSDNPPINKKIQYKQEFFSSFKMKDDEQVLKKQYTADISLQVELRHQPYMCTLSSKKKQRKRSSNRLSINRPSTPTSGKLSFEQMLRDNNNQKNQNSSPSTMNHDMKFLIHVIENYKLFDEEDDFQIFFVHELNPVLLKTSLKKLESVKKNLLRSISHEMLTNLNAAYGYIKQCQDRLLKGEEMSELLACALRYTKLQLFKVQDFFDYRYLLDNKLKLREDKFELINAITECVDLIKDQIYRKQLSYQLDIPENCAYIVKGDRQRFCQVILNLLTNAIKFTIQGGITVEVKKKKNSPSCFGIIDEVQSQLSQEDSNILEIYIKDSGLGMDEDELVTLRKKLHVADEDEKVSKYSVGVGLGLSVCKSIIRQLAPENSNLLFVDSVKDSGSSFYFSLRYIEEKSSIQKSQQLTIPYQDAQSASVKVLNYNKGHQLAAINIFKRSNSNDLSIEIPKKRQDQCNCETILIVDDEQFNIDIIAHIIKEMGFYTETALNGKQAIEKISKKLQDKCSGKCTGYHCILMDINMPLMSGWEAVQIIRQMECELQLVKAIPVVAVTAFCSIQDQEKSINEGFDGVIIKPATKEKIKGCFENLNL
ncbi:unnamed protein product (macronuclear) [Paramecium tetraurelia]|uniref:Uncharacterized protein n=1 Tax=Paramecium tetraurelia TaxID=5888 RepID=A0C0D5_PARTE|nr:uncharacterized protein GSPATT00006105001 [Paramecium tetraurelia]CAK64252.1 unnamed protein product [Paramecium tetraurelia]|eukprot:XP_001431650.1 hypothetical protein (macronuclear) [Paramecium tetraurelia strain d4-2]